LAYVRFSGSYLTPNPDYGPWPATCVTGTGTAPGTLTDIPQSAYGDVYFLVPAGTEATKITGTICSNSANAWVDLLYGYPGISVECYGQLGSCELKTGPSKTSFSHLVPSDANLVEFEWQVSEAFTDATDWYGAFRAIAYLSSSSSSG
jgi:hypothetical protein